MRPLKKLFLVGAMAAVGGIIANRIGLPVGFLIGAAVVTAVAGLNGMAVQLPPTLYRAALVVVGTGVGLGITTDIVARLGSVFWQIPAAALVSIAISWAMTPLFCRLSGTSLATAHFSLVPAGIAEMAETSARYGADTGTVATMHALRVMLVVLVLPAALTLHAEPQAYTATAMLRSGAWTPGLALALAIGAVAGRLGSLVRIPNPYMLTPILAVVTLSGAGFVAAAEPRLLSGAAQILIGINLGARFDRSTIRRLPRAFATAIPVMLLHLGLMSALAAGMAYLAGIDLPTALLGFATGGTVEMVLTAGAVGASVGIVTAFQVARGVFGNALAGLIYRYGYALSDYRPTERQ
ncbi:AbrB family transcriptional regulator [Aquamicrobium terrae]